MINVAPDGCRIVQVTKERKYISYYGGLLNNRCFRFRFLPFPKQALCFTCQYKSFENMVGKGEIACNEQFLLYPSVFYPFGELSAIFIKYKFVVCKLFHFGRVLSLSIGNWLNEDKSFELF